MDAIVSPAAQPTDWPKWAEHSPASMARDFLLWRHFRVMRARTMSRVFKYSNAMLSRLSSGRDQHPPMRTTYGVHMHTNWTDRTYMYCHYGTYGRYLADLIHSLDRPFLFLDVGANQGLYSLIAGQNPFCERIVALEPVAGTQALLERNLALNGLCERASAPNFGLSDRDSQFTIAINTAHSGVATIAGHLNPDDRSVRHEQIELRSMDALTPYLPDHLPIFVKVDVEGHEATVIEQILGSPHADRVLGIFYEYDARWCDADELRQIFARTGFATTRQYGRGSHFDALATPVRAAAGSAPVEPAA